jgi:phage shock protein A
MPQSNDIEHRFHLVEQAIGQAAQASSAERNLPSELRDSIQRVDRLSDSAREIVRSQDAARIRQLIADMASLAERAKRVCTNIPSLSAQMKGSVTHMHSQIQELKRDVL